LARCTQLHLKCPHLFKLIKNSTVIRQL